MKTWAIHERKRKGTYPMPKVSAKTIKRRRARLRENLQAEARDIQNLARTFALEAMHELYDLVKNSDKGSDKIAAAQVILERAYGKATQTSINANLDANGKPAEVTSKELDTRIAETLERVETLTSRAAKEEPGEGQPADVRVSDRDSGNSSLH